jgi:hypothetical protein
MLTNQAIVTDQLVQNRFILLHGYYIDRFSDKGVLQERTLLMCAIGDQCLIAEFPTDISIDPRIIISDTSEPEYTRLESRGDHFRTFGCSGIYNSQDCLSGKVGIPWWE